GTGLGLGKFVDCRSNHLSQPSVDSVHLAAVNGAHRLGEVAHCGYRTLLWRSLFYGRLRFCRERGAAHQMGLVAESAAYDFRGLGQSFSDTAVVSSASRRNRSCVVRVGIVAHCLRFLLVALEQPPEGT